LAGVSVTWLGHAAFRIDSPGGTRVHLDPWLSNPKSTESLDDVERVDVMAITHGHADHVGEAIELGKRFRPKVVAIAELAGWLEQQGVEGASSLGMNKGGTVEVHGLHFTMVQAVHSSGFGPDREYLGEPAGYVIGFEDGTRVYFAGDTAVHSDMQLIGRLYEPKVAVLPVGDHFTMGPREAAVAVELLGVRRMLPCHWGTFDVLTGTPEACKELVSECEVIDAQPGDTVEL
jgi:L-ascorbate metabolism protein UlaG (beta-lactamase superfamily)